MPEEATAITDEKAKCRYIPSEVRERVYAPASYGLTLNVIKPPAYSSSSRLPRRTYRDALVRAVMYSLSKESSPQYARVQARSSLIDRRFPLTSQLPVQLLQSALARSEEDNLITEQRAWHL